METGIFPIKGNAFLRLEKKGKDGFTQYIHYQHIESWHGGWMYIYKFAPL
jgi:hypothetical protein